MHIVGRHREQERLQRILQAKRPAFLAVYGRRRIGKTYLIKHFFKDKGLFFHLTGIQDGSLEAQLGQFSVEFSDVFLKGKERSQPKDWFEACQLLRKEIEKIPKQTKAIIFFDELPWIVSPRSQFLQALEHLWNRYLSEMPNVILIVCGSSVSWMVDNIINNKGGLHGRVTEELRLSPFTLSETEEFLKERGIILDRKQILELYMCFGGVAKYLSYVEKGKSVAQMVGELCFSYNAPLIAEFHKLYRSLFSHHEDHEQIVSLLAQHPSGLTYQELGKKTGISAGGTLTHRLEELKQSGFIMQTFLLGKGEKNVRYILIDEYSFFYLTWHAGVSALDLQSRGPDYWIQQRNSQSWKTWTGYAFECVCLKHIEGIKAALGLAAVQTTATRWYYAAPRRSGKNGAAVDLVIDRADQCINFCEIKFYSDKFVITKAYAEKLRQRRECFIEQTGTQKPTFMTLITTYGAKHNQQYFACIDKEVTADALFIA